MESLDLLKGKKGDSDGGSDAETEYQYLKNSYGILSDSSFEQMSFRFAHTHPEYTAAHFSEYYGMLERKSQALLSACLMLEDEKRYEEIVLLIDPFYEYLVQNQEQLLENRYCTTGLIEELLLQCYFLSEHPEYSEVDDTTCAAVLTIYMRALYDLLHKKGRKELTGKFSDVYGIIIELSQFCSEPHVTVTDFMMMEAKEDLEKGMEFLDRALTFTVKRGDYGLPGIYRRLGNLYALKETGSRKEIASACYTMAIFFGDDEIQGICREQVSRLGLEIMGTSHALKIFDENKIQFGYSDLVKESARLLREKYLHINPDLNYRDILTDPRELIEAAGN